MTHSVVTVCFYFNFSGSPDILICGNCREMFSDLVDIIDHKKDYCKLRFTCKCDYLNLDNNHDHATSDVNETGKANADNQQNKGKGPLEHFDQKI
jgi:hypothetical protein